MKAIWKDQLLAESEDIILIEGNHYFPFDSINKTFFRESDTNTICPMKGTAYFLDINVEGEVKTDAAWYYPHASKFSSVLKGRICFWRGVEVVK